MNLFCFDASYKCLVTVKKEKSQSVFNQVKISTSLNVRSLTSSKWKKKKKQKQATFRSFDVHLFHKALSFLVAFSLPTRELFPTNQSNRTVLLVFLVLFLGDHSTHWPEWPLNLLCCPPGELPHDLLGWVALSMETFWGSSFPRKTQSNLHFIPDQ